MALRIIKCSTAEDAQAVLQGVVKTKKIDAGLYGLVGKTLTFTQPTGATCTFVAGARSDGFLTFAEISAQLKTAIANLTVGQKDGAMWLRSMNTNGVTITGGTARADLGLQADGTTRGAVYAAPGGAAPVLVTCYYAEGAHVLVVDDA